MMQNKSLSVQSSYMYETDFVLEKHCQGLPKK